MAGPNRTRKAPAGPKEVPTKGTRFAPSSRKAPKPTGLVPGDPGYGIKSNSTKDPIGRAARVTGTTTSRDLPSGQSALTGKVKRSVC
jgi:hypothetical protein